MISGAIEKHDIESRPYMIIWAYIPYHTVSPHTIGGTTGFSGLAWPHGLKRLGREAAFIGFRLSVYRNHPLLDWLVIYLPLWKKNIKVSWYDYSQYMENEKYSKARQL